MIELTAHPAFYLAFAYASMPVDLCATDSNASVTAFQTFDQGSINPKCSAPGNSTSRTGRSALRAASAYRRLRLIGTCAS
ncbi:MAG TPA: hypothetical protein VNV66_09175, partial [Pilimelia sp.]|nr:hypothetical protein [Pilimelia sp.]